MGITIQDLGSSEDMKGLNILHLTKEAGDKTIERIIIRMKDEFRAFVEVGEFT